jgi:hypothetical protein
MIGTQKLVNTELTYKNVVHQLRRRTPLPTPPAWVKGKDHSLNDSEWLCRTKYKLWGCNSKFLDFCHRWHAGFLYARKQLHRFGIKDSPACQMCGEDPQTVVHLLWHCPEVNRIKDNITQRWGLNDMSSTHALVFYPAFNR